MCLTPSLRAIEGQGAEGPSHSFGLDTMEGFKNHKRVGSSNRFNFASPPLKTKSLANEFFPYRGDDHCEQAAFDDAVGHEPGCVRIRP